MLCEIVISLSTIFRDLWYSIVDYRMKGNIDISLKNPFIATEKAVKEYCLKLMNFYNVEHWSMIMDKLSLESKGKAIIYSIADFDENDELEGVILTVKSKPLVKLDLPLYPDGSLAIIDFLGLNTNVPIMGIFIQIPNYRVRIENLTLSDKFVMLEIFDGEENLDNFYVKCYGKRESGVGEFSTQRITMMHSPNLELINNIAEFEFKEKFDYIMATLLDRKSGELLDLREYYLSWEPYAGIKIEHAEYNITEIINRGENENSES